jgi:DNA-binding MarR family transcriptional regulator
VISPALRDANTDRDLRGWPVHVLLYLHGILDIGEDRHIKAWLVAQEIGAKRRTVTHALRLLVDKGYLRTGRRAEANIGSYRLVSTLERATNLVKRA